MSDDHSPKLTVVAGSRAPRHKLTFAERRDYSLSQWSEDDVDRFLERVAAGERVTDVCKDADMPSVHLVQWWAKKSPEFKERYEAAKEAQAQVRMDRVAREVNDAQPANIVDVRHLQLRFDVEKWVAERQAPKGWGAKMRQEHTVAPDAGKDGQTVQFFLPDNRREIEGEVVVEGQEMLESGSNKTDEN